MIRSFIKILLGFSTFSRRINYYMTLVVNLKLFGLKGIIVKPVIVYSNTKIFALGDIRITCPLKRGVLTIGGEDYKSQGITKFANYGTIIVKDYVVLGGASIIENYGTMEFDGYNRISDGSSLLIRTGLYVGEQTRIGFHSCLMDSDDHYTIDCTTREVRTFSKAIRLGRYNWLGNTTYVKKGVITPDYLIVASPNALLTKDYSSLEPYSVLGGAPAKLIKTGIRRIFNKEEEARLHDAIANSDDAAFTYDDSLSLDEICRQNNGII